MGIYSNYKTYKQDCKFKKAFTCLEMGMKILTDTI